MDERQYSRRTFLDLAGRGAVAVPVLAQLASARQAFADDLGAQSATTTDGLPQRLRDAYSLDPRLTYFNHASIGTIPRAVQSAHRRYLEVCETNPWLYIWGGDWTEPRSRVRQEAAVLLGCAAKEVALTHNTTETFNLLAQGLPLGEGDEVLFSSLNHTGASACWFHMAERRGFRVRQFDFPIRDVPGLSRSDVLRIYGEQIRTETRILVFPHVDNMVGLLHPVTELAALARRRGVRYVAVDAAQTVGMIPLDVSAMGVDVYATSPHKWLQAPKGLGLTYVRQEMFDQLAPMWVTWGQKGYQGSARVYEDYGTRNLPEVLALGDAIEFQNNLGAAQKKAHYLSLRQRGRELVEADPALTWRSPHAEDLAAASLWSFEVRGESAKDIFARLFREHGFVFRAFDLDDFDAIRISPNAASDRRSIERLFETLA